MTVGKYLGIYLKHESAIISGDDRYGGLEKALRSGGRAEGIVGDKMRKYLNLVLDSGAKSNRRDAWAEGIIDWVERFLRSAGLERATWLIIAFAAGYFADAIRIIINRPH